MSFQSACFFDNVRKRHRLTGVAYSLGIAAATIVAMLLMSPSAQADKPTRPNVLFILCDDLRPDAVGCLGSKHVKTPHIDAVAAAGVRFTNSFCTTSLCSPSRASILTGLYAHAHGVRNNFTELPADLTT